MSLDARLSKSLPKTPDSLAFGLDVHLKAEAGVTVLLGPSGAGKSLTLNCIGGFVKPDKGRILLRDEIYFDAEAGVNRPPRERRCGYIFQDHALFPHMTVRQNLEFAGAVAGKRGPKGLQRRRRISELLESFELSDLANRRSPQLSGGQRQRAALARILMSEPRLLLLDEPTRGLDGRLRDNFYRLLKETEARLGTPIIMVSHDLEECFRVADAVCLLEAGQVLQAGPAASVLTKPRSLEAARALGLFNIVPAEILALDPGRNTSRLRVLGSEVEVAYLPGHLIGDRGHLCVRESETEAVRTQNRSGLQSDVVAVEQTPFGVRLELTGELAARVPQAEWLAWQTEGTPTRVAVRFRPEAVNFIG